MHHIPLSTVVSKIFDCTLQYTPTTLRQTVELLDILTHLLIFKDSDISRFSQIGWRISINIFS